MNHVYRLVWNPTLQALVAVYESARGRSKSGGKAASTPALLASVLIAACAMPAGAVAINTLPSGGQVTAGAAAISSTANTLTVQQSTQKAAINWQSFSVGSNATVNFVQPNASSVILNRVVGTEQSVIAGALNANGQVFLLNSNGVLFTGTSSVNVGGLVASTLNLNDADFMAGRSTFSANGSKASVINLGTITAADGGYVALLGNQVKNEGVITAKLGTAILAAGDQTSLNFNGDSLVGVTIDQGTLNALVENKQAIYADGGLVVLTAKGLDAVMATVVNNTGEIRAQTIADKEGKIYLLGGMDNNRIEVGGTLDASAPYGGNGGFIETSAAKVKFAEGVAITTAAANGQQGQWLIDPRDFTVALTGGDITGAALGALLGSNSITIETATAPTASAMNLIGGAGTNGDIFVNDNITKSAGTDATLTFKADRNIIIESGVTIESTSNKLNVNFSANNSGAYSTGANSTVISIQNSSINTNGGNLIIGGALTSGLPNTGVFLGVNTQILGSTLNTGGGNITIGGDQIIMGEYYTTPLTVSSWNDYFNNPVTSNSNYRRTYLTGENIKLESVGSQNYNSILVDATDFVVGNSLTLKTSGFRSIGQGNINFEGATYDQIDWNAFIYNRRGTVLLNAPTQSSSFQSLPSSITFTGGNILSLESADNIIFAWMKAGIEGGKLAPIALNFSDSATISIKTMQGTAMSGLGVDDAAIKQVLRGVYDESNVYNATGYSTSNLWDGYMFTTAGFYDIHGGTVSTQMFSDGSVANGWARSAYHPITLNNGYLAFGNGFNDSINQFGLIRSPFYFDGTQWRQLTFSDLPMSIIIGIGGDGTNNFNLNGSVVSSLETSADFAPGAFSNTVLDTSGFNHGTGIIKATTNIVVDGKALTLENVYSLPASERLIGTNTKLTNVSGQPLSNVRLWVGVQDDYVAGVDWAINRTRGNLVGGVFVPTAPSSYSTEQSQALILDTVDSGILFHTSSANASTFITTYDWNNNYNAAQAAYDSGRFNSTSPANSINTRASDGLDAGYGVFSRFTDLANGGVDSVRWYYGAGALADMATTAQSAARGVSFSVPSITVPDNSLGAAQGVGFSVPSITVPDSSLGNTIANAISTQRNTQRPWTDLPNGAVSAYGNAPGSDQPNAFVNVTNPLPEVSAAFGPGERFAVISSPSADEPTQAITLSQARSMMQSPGQGSGGASDGDREVRVPVSRNSLADIVNGGVKLPDGVEQQLFVVQAN